MSPNICVAMNGPPQIGKDTLVRELLKLHPSMTSMTLAKLVRKECADYYGDPNFVTKWDIQGWKDSTIAGDELNKALSCSIRGFKTPRQQLIHFSEKIMKRQHGEDVWAKRFAAECRKVKNPIMTDLGFDVEAKKLSQVMDLVIVVQLHHPEYSFQDDSRDYVNASAHNVITIQHDVVRGDPVDDAKSILHKITTAVEACYNL